MSRVSRDSRRDRLAARLAIGARNLLLLLTLMGFGLDTCLNTAQAANGSVVYTYDALGRVTTANYDTGVIVIYSYDANGNRTQRVVHVSTTTLTWTPTTTPCTSNCWGSFVW